MKKVFTIIFMIAASIPALSVSQTYEETRNFCKISQMLIPIFLRGGEISGESVCTVGGGASYQCSSSMSLGAGVCVAGGGASYQCNNSMSLEPRRVCRRLISVSYAAMASVSRAA